MQSDRIIFKVFYKAMSTTGYAYALTLPRQAIALFLRFSTRRCLRRATPTTHSYTTGDRIIFEVFCKAIAYSSTTAIALFSRFSVKRSLFTITPTKGFRPLL
ncbi:hypothetical protein [Nostoc sp.]|uniref:hypothetical protein n=1 Tax=Nostoc sp. TaxID=1180 RepID=UPI002FFCCE4E